jgi:uncharacterized membrane protein YecN with MAPEG domain
MPPLLPSLMTCLALIFYFAVSFNVGRMRVKHGIQAPATTGHPEFERAFRVQQNTLEQIVFFLPSLWLFTLTVAADWAAALGALWLVGRVIYAQSYYRDATARGPGFMIGTVASLILLAGALVAIVMALVRQAG